MFFLSCVCFVFVPICLYVLCCHLLGKVWPLGSRLWCLTVSLSLSHLYLGSGLVLDCIDSWSLHPYLLWSQCPGNKSVLFLQYQFVNRFTALNIEALISSCQTAIHLWLVPGLLSVLLMWPFHRSCEYNGVGHKIMLVIFNFTTYTIRVTYQVAFI